MKPVYLYITPFYPAPGDWRGGYSSDFVAALQRTGKYDVRVFVPGMGEDYDFNGVRVYRFPTRQLPSAVFPFLFKRWNVKSFLAAIDAAGIDLSDIAVCHCNTAYCGIYAIGVRNVTPHCKTVLHHHALESFGLNRGRLSECWLHNVIQFPILRRMHEVIDLHVFISEKCRESFLAAPDASWTTYRHYRRQMRGLGFYRPAKIHDSLILHNGVDTNLFCPGSRKCRPGSSFVIGCVGNFDQQKGQMRLLEALALIKEDLGDWRLKFVGSGALEGKMRAFISANGLTEKVEFLPEMAHGQLPEFYRSLDLFVLPSVFEGFGCVFTEAYVCGVPFISCSGSGIDDLLTGEARNLWLARPYDIPDLAGKILSFYRNRPRQELSGEIGIDPLVQDFVR